jgi:hypothetical protein
MSVPARPAVLFVYYSYTEQTRRLAEAMADVLCERGCDVQLARIGFTDKRWAERFTRLPLRHAYGDILGMAPAQIWRRRTHGRGRVRVAQGLGVPSWSPQVSSPPALAGASRSRQLVYVFSLACVGLVIVGLEVVAHKV